MKSKDFWTYYFESCASTMDEAKTIAQNRELSDIFCVVTKNQTAGRGRNGSAWVQGAEVENSPVCREFSHLKKVFMDTMAPHSTDFLPLTFVLPSQLLKAPLPWLTALVGCAVYDALKECEQFLLNVLPLQPVLTPTPLFLKWPNDIIHFAAGGSQKKLCGVLCEASYSGNQTSAYFIGIGLNFLTHPDLEKSTSFLDYMLLRFKKKLTKKEVAKHFDKAMRSLLLERFVDALCRELVEYLCHFRVEEQLQNIVLARSLPIGTLMAVNKGTRIGKFLGLAPNAGLLLEGFSEPIYSGEIEVYNPSKPKDDEALRSDYLEDTCYIGIDFGNTRIHIFCEETPQKNFHIDIPYTSNTIAVLQEKLRIQFFSFSFQNLVILYSSVNTPEKTNDALKKIKLFFKQRVKILAIQEKQITEKEIFSCMNLQGDFEIERLGADRALKFFYAYQESQRLKKNILIFSFGTAVTCEGVSATGEILENFIFPGLQMAFEAMHEHTALLPSFSPNATLFSPEGKHWNQEIYMQRGVFMSAAASVITTVVLHEPCLCYLSGGNAAEVKTIIKSILARQKKEIHLELTSNIESALLVKFFKSMIPQRKPNDFRKIGQRVENIKKAERIDAYMAQKFKFLKRDAWKKRILNNEVLVEQQSPRLTTTETSKKLTTVKPTYRIQNFDQIWSYHLPGVEPEVEAPVDVLFDDTDYCVFAKPAHMVVHAVGIHGKNTFMNAIEKMGFKNCAPVHRIDRETSGILVCARQSATRNSVAGAFRTGHVAKLYLAITKGTAPVPERFQVTSPIGEPENSRIRLKLWVHGRNPQTAATHFVKLAQQGEWSLFACLPKTGRTNQIRIHLASVGHWIVGDKMYHENEAVFLEFFEKGLTPWVEEHVLFARHLLHNAGLMVQGIHLPPLSTSPVICPVSNDFYDFNQTLALFEKAGVPLESEKQKDFLKDLFLSLHALPNSDFPIFNGEAIQ